MGNAAAIGVVIQNLGNSVIDEAKLQSGVSEQVENLRVKLGELLSVIQNAQERQIYNVWISRSRDLAYEAEDLLEEYDIKIESQSENILKRSTHFLKKCYDRRSIGLKIQKLETNISNMTKSFVENGIASIVNDERESSNSFLQQHLRLTYPHILNDDFIKLGDNVEKLVEHLVNENEDGVASIIGMGGLGKTTLAKKVFNHEKTQNYFENLAWVCISQKWQKREILQRILKDFLPKQKRQIKEDWIDEELVREVFETLRDKKCLVVLDDIWSVDAWESIKEAFPMRNNGSKILLTIRNRTVALQIGPYGFHHEPRPLNDLESWELLQIKAFGERTQIVDEQIHEMIELGKEMSKYCAGLPLAVVVLGGILATKKGIEEWKIVHNNVKAHIGRGMDIVQEQGEIEKILALSYNELPMKLKLCFVYLSIFPEDSEIDVETLYQLWIAEGMISMKDQIIVDESMMDVAERYLRELAERSLVQVIIDEDMVRTTRFTSCRLHDLVRDMSLEKAREENLFSLVHSKNGLHHQVYKSSSPTNQIHRLVIHLEKSEDVSKYIPPLKRTTRHLRSLKLIVESGDYKGPMTKIIYSQISQFQMLRSLEISGLSLPNDDIVFHRHLFCLGSIDSLKSSKVLGNLIHLRYLSLSGYLFLCLPSSFGNLKQLQTLDLRYAHNPFIANIIWKMTQLKHLYLPKTSWLSFPHHKLRLNGLNKVEILEAFDSRSCCVEDLVELSNLRWLQARLYFENDNIVETLMILLDLKSLTKIDLEIRIPDHDLLGITEKRSKLFSKLFSCGKLLKLFIEIPIGKLPKYEIGLASHLVELYLVNSKFEEDPMETLGKLSNLKTLYLLWNSFLGTEMYCYSDGFLQLRELEFWGLPNLEKWIISEGTMPNLSILQIYDCKRFKKMPDGLIFLRAIKKLTVDWMSENLNRRISSDR